MFILLVFKSEKLKTYTGLFWDLVIPPLLIDGMLEGPLMLHPRLTGDAALFRATIHPLV
jgi:hypothetical protein